ncbi:hypothetical protein [Streptomyces olivaceus]|uniref:hypothetical protein n=1 Tax=Streptomyces olivaceus TaxID=47716 RepID=UPI004055DAFA
MGESAEPWNPPELPFGPLILTSASGVPERIKAHELDDGGPGKLKGADEDEEARNRGRRLRVNPLLRPLDDIPPDWILKGREGAVWLYSAVFRPDDPDKPETARWQIMLGSEELLTVIPEETYDYLMSYSATYAARERVKYPNKEARVLTRKDIDDLKEGMNKLGHPTITVEYEKTGQTVEGRGAQSGEFRYFPQQREGEANDKSGRYMSPKVRGALGLPTDPADVRKWGLEVAAALEDKLGVPVRFNQVKTAPKQPHEAIAAHTTTLLPKGGARRAEAPPGQSAAASRNRRAAGADEQPRRRR